MTLPNDSRNSTLFRDSFFAFELYANAISSITYALYYFLRWTTSCLLDSGWVSVYQANWQTICISISKNYTLCFMCSKPTMVIPLFSTSCMLNLWHLSKPVSFSPFTSPLLPAYPPPPHNPWIHSLPHAVFWLMPHTRFLARILQNTRFYRYVEPPKAPRPSQATCPRSTAFYPRNPIITVTEHTPTPSPDYMKRQVSHYHCYDYDLVYKVCPSQNKFPLKIW